MIKVTHKRKAHYDLHQDDETGDPLSMDSVMTKCITFLGLSLYSRTEFVAQTTKHIKGTAKGVGFQNNKK